jgi:hypothetical protein
MQEPTEEAEASISTENVRENPDENLNQTFAARRTAAKRTLPWDLAAGELHLVSNQSQSPPLPPQAEDVPATKKRRLEEPLPTTADEAARKTASPDVSVDLPPPAVDNNADVNTDPMPDKQPNAGADRAITRWTPDEDAKLTSAFANTSKKKWGDEYVTDWEAVAALVPGRTKSHCYDRWRHALDPSILQANVRTGRWIEDEDIRLKNAVQTHGGKNWDAIAALVPGRAERQCRGRWRYALDPSIVQANERTGKWAEDEDIKLKYAVLTHGDKDWGAIAALVPGRTKGQCKNRWHHVLDPSIDRATGRTGTWSEDEDIKLKDAVQTHGGKNWDAVAAMVPGRATRQCQSRWQCLHSQDRLANGLAGKWTEDEDSKLKDAVQTHSGKNWGAIAALVPGRVTSQCRHRWHRVLDPSINRTTGCTGTWLADEDTKLKDAVQTHGGKNWDGIAALVPGRTKIQCYDRWCHVLDPNTDRTTGRTGKWVEDEDIKLKDAVQTHGDKDWFVIATLVPGRTRAQCRGRWHALLHPSIDKANGRA